MVKRVVSTDFCICRKLLNLFNEKKNQMKYCEWRKTNTKFCNGWLKCDYRILRLCVWGLIFFLILLFMLIELFVFGLWVWLNSVIWKSTNCIIIITSPATHTNTNALHIKTDPMHPIGINRLRLDRFNHVSACVQMRMRGYINLHLLG